MGSKTNLGSHLVLQRETKCGFGNSYILGNQDRSLGKDWSAGGAYTFTIDLTVAGSLLGVQTVTLNADTDDIDECVAHIQKQINASLLAAFGEGYKQMVIVGKDSTNTYIWLGCLEAEAMALADTAGDPVATHLGIVEATYSKKMVDGTQSKVTGNYDVDTNIASIDWSAGAMADFKLAINNRAGYTINLTTNPATEAAMVDDIQAAIDVHYTNSEFTVSVNGSHFITIAANGFAFTITDGTATPLDSDMGITAGTYEDGNLLVNAPKEGGNVPFEIPHREQVFLMNDSKRGVGVLEKGHMYKDGSMSLHLQDMLLLKIALEGTRNLEIPSFIAHWKDTVDDHESYGVQIHQYTLNLASSEWAEQVMESMNRHTLEANVNTFTTDADYVSHKHAQTKPRAWYNVPITIGGYTVDVTDGSLVIINDSDKDNLEFVGKILRAGAILDRQKLELELTYRSSDEAARRLVNVRTKAITELSIVFTFEFPDGDVVMTLNGMYVDPESVNVGDLKDGFVEYTAKYLCGDNFTIAWS